MKNKNKLKQLLIILLVAVLASAFLQFNSTIKYIRINSEDIHPDSLCWKYFYYDSTNVIKSFGLIQCNKTIDIVGEVTPIDTYIVSDTPGVPIGTVIYTGERSIYSYIRCGIWNYFNEEGNHVKQTLFDDNGNKIREIYFSENYKVYRRIDYLLDSNNRHSRVYKDTTYK